MGPEDTKMEAKTITTPDPSAPQHYQSGDEFFAIDVINLQNNLTELRNRTASLEIKVHGNTSDASDMPVTKYDPSEQLPQVAALEASAMMVQGRVKKLEI